jgi:hypothetical protein
MHHSKPSVGESEKVASAGILRYNMLPAEPPRWFRFCFFRVCFFVLLERFLRERLKVFEAKRISN